MGSVLVLYHSQEHGNTAAMAEAVSAGATDAGADVQIVNTNQQRLSMDLYRWADAVAFGSPDYYSYIAGGMKVFLDDWFIAKKTSTDRLTDKPYGLFYSHGGGGKVREPMETLFAKTGTQIGQTIASQGAPDAEALGVCRQLGAQLAQAAASQST